MATTPKDLKEIKSKKSESSQDWERTKTILTLAASQPNETRTGFVEEQLPNDPLCTKVLSLLETIDRVKHALGREGPPQISEDLLRPGEQYGSYRVIRALGKGGMGQVFLAEDVLLRRRVALKTLFGDWMNSPVARQKLLQEARAVAQLEHQNIVRLYELFDDQRCFLMVMEYVEGRSAAAMIDDGPIPLGLAVRLGIQICDALVYAHDHSILHCDLKPLNVQITPDGTAKVLDFGLSRARYHSDAFDPDEIPHDRIVGTPAYMAPEQFQPRATKESGDAFRADVYSLGVTIFELVTGRKPFKESNLPALVGAILETSAPKVSSIVPTCPNQLEKVIERAMAKDPKQRYQTAREVGRDLREVLQILDADTRELPSPASPIARPVHSRLLWLALVLLGSILSLTLIGFLTSTFYFSPLGVPMTEGESPLWWPVWGLRSLVLPLTQIGVATLVFGMASQLWKMTFETFPVIRRWYSKILARKFIQRLSSLKLSILAAGLLVVQVVTLDLVMGRFGTVFDSFTSMLLGSGNLEILSPGHSHEHQWFRRVFSLLVLIFSWGWYRLLNSQRRRQESLGTITVATGGFLMILTLFCMVVPYRMFVHNKAELVFYQSRPCYLVGERKNEARLFCPYDSPRSRLVRMADLQRTGVPKSIFSVRSDSDLDLLKTQ